MHTATAIPDTSLTAPGAASHDLLSAVSLQALGLKPEDAAEIRSLAATVDATRQESIYAFGRDVAQHTSTQTDAMLDQVRANELEGLGSKLSGIVSTAQSLNLHALTDQRSRLPFIGGLIDKLRLNKDELLQRFKTVRAQIDGLVSEVGTMQQGLQERIKSLDESFFCVKQEHRLLGLHIAAGQVATAQLQSDIARLQAQAQAGELAGMQVQVLQDTLAAAATLDKRIADLRVLQHAALQTLPMIRMVQTNSNMLIEKFHSVKELTLPAWKRQFMLSLSLNEQKNAVQLADSIDDATNQLLKENALLLKQNTVSTAKANQRLAIDIETLQQVQDTLLATVQEVIKINQDGMAHRQGVSEQLGAMRAQLQLHFTRAE